MLFWNHLGISFPLSTGSTGKTNFWVLWAGPDLTLTFMILTWPSPGTWTSRTPCISWYKSNYLNIRIFCIIRIFVHWFPKKRILFVIRIRPILISEYYSLFVFVPFSLFVATLIVWVYWYTPEQDTSSWRSGTGATLLGHCPTPWEILNTGQSEPRLCEVRLCVCMDGLSNPSETLQCLE